jgi:hypothetical protein
MTRSMIFAPRAGAPFPRPGVVAYGMQTEILCRKHNGDCGSGLVYVRERESERETDFTPPCCLSVWHVLQYQYIGPCNFSHATRENAFACDRTLACGRSHCLVLLWQHARHSERWRTIFERSVVCAVKGPPG